MKFGNLVEICFWLNSVSDEVNCVLKDTPLPVASHTDVLGIALRDEKPLPMLMCGPMSC